MAINFFFALVVLSLTVFVLVAWVITRKAVFGKSLGITWLLILALVTLVLIAQPLTSKKVLTRDDYYGEYVIDTTYFRKTGAWQYNTFHFVIKPDDSNLFLYNSC